MKSERIQTDTNETESCYTCESICMPSICMLIKHTTRSIVFEAEGGWGADISKKNLDKPKKGNLTSQNDENPYRGGGNSMVINFFNVPIYEKCLLR